METCEECVRLRRENLILQNTSKILAKALTDPYISSEYTKTGNWAVAQNVAHAQAVTEQEEFEEKQAASS